jgi:hypothetical protein
VAAPDSGVVRSFLHCPPDDVRAREAGLAQLRAAGFAVGFDTDPSLLVHRLLAEGVINMVAAQQPSLVLITQRHASTAPILGSSGEAVAAMIIPPVAIVIGDATEIADVQLIATERSEEIGGDDRMNEVAVELAARLGGRKATTREVSELPSASELRPGQVWVAPATSWELLAASDPPDGAALVLVLASGPDGVHGEPLSG